LDGPGLPVCRDEGEDFAFRESLNKSTDHALRR